MPKKQLISVIFATAFAVVASILFQVISLVVISGYGDTAKEAFSLASSRQFGKLLIIIIVCAIIYLVSCFSNPKYTKTIFIVCGIISCIVGGYICIRTSIYFSGYVKPNIEGLELDFDQSKLMEEDLTLFGKERTDILEQWNALIGDKGEE